MASTLAGQVAIVTGGGRGIGLAVGQTLVRAGAAVTLVARSQDEIDAATADIVQSGGRALGLTADVRDSSSVRRTVEQTIRHFGPVTLLVNNAGTPGPVGPDWEVDADSWWEGVEVAVRGAFLFNQAVSPG